MAKHLGGEIELEGHDLPGGALTPAQIKAIRLKIASSTKEYSNACSGFQHGQWNPTNKGDASSTVPCAHCCASLTASQGPLFARQRLREAERIAEVERMRDFFCVSSDRRRTTAPEAKLWREFEIARGVGTQIRRVDVIFSGNAHQREEGAPWRCGNHSVIRRMRVYMSYIGHEHEDC
jgi:hypothetical protein